MRAAVFALSLMAVATALHRAGLVETRHYLLSLAIVAAQAALGFVLAAIGLVGLWKHGYAGGRRAAAALALSILTLTPFAYALYKASTLPKIADISTDLADPPQFAQTGGMGPQQELQGAAYPNVTGRRYGLAGESLVALVERQIETAGWKVEQRRGSLGATGEIVIEARATTLIAGFKDKVAIRITDEGATSYLDMRSKSGFGEYDMGVNAARIVKFMLELDTQAATGGAQTAK